MQFLLKTKLNIPALTASQSVKRPRLLHTLTESASRRLTLISAPPGSGKTTLLAEWASTIDNPFTWLTLDEDDNDPMRFWRYILLALQKIQPHITDELLELLDANQAPAQVVSLTAESDTPIIIVLDDYHAIENQQVHEGINFLLNHMAAHVHLIISSRADPPLPLGRLRVRGQLAELRATDIRFMPDEAAVFLRDIMGLTLTKSHIEALDRKTEGWIAGLHLAGLSLQGKDDINTFIDAFAGTNRYLMDYLIEEVLDHQPEHIRDFLLRTSILSAFCAPLCDAVCDISNSQYILETLEHTNQFFTPVDDNREWYTCHQLFADLLRHRLRQYADVASLHRQAALWYEGAGMYSHAIYHMLEIEDYTHTAALIEQAADEVWSSGELVTFRNWIEQLPQTMLYASPRLCVYAARTMLSIGPIERVKPLLDAAEKQLDDELWLGRVDAIRTTQLRADERYDDGYHMAKRALSRLPDDDYHWRSLALMSLSGCHYARGELTETIQVMEQAYHVAQLSNGRFIAYFTVFGRGEVLMYMGKLAESAAMYAEHLKGSLPVQGWAFAGLGAIYREYGDMDSALEHIEMGLALGLQGQIDDVIRRGYVYLTQWQLSTGALDAALQTAQEFNNFAKMPGIPLTWRWAGAILARVWLAHGEIAQAVAWAEALQFSSAKYSFIYQFELGTLLRIKIAAGYFREVVVTIDDYLPQIEPLSHTLTTIELLILKALALAEMDENAAALAALRQALVLAEFCGFVRLFLDEGLPMLTLLDKVKNTHPYAAKLIGHDNVSVPDGLAEALTDRETEVLQLIAAGASNADIADQLVISVATVKKHISNLFLKLDVSNRTQAVARARELRLLR